MTDLARLVVKLEAETSQYQQQLAAATKQLEGFQNSVTDFAEDLVKKFAAAFTVDKIVEFVAGAIESAAALEKLSQESGVAVEELSALQAVFAQSGVGQDEMASSLKKLNQAISEAAGNPTSKAAFAFQALGISITNSNGSLKTASQLLPNIADAYQRLADGPNKVAINTDLLGKSAQALIPTLNQGSAALNDLEQAAQDSGATLSGELAAAAEDLEKKMIALKQSFTGTISTEVLEAALPALNAFVDGMHAIGKEGNATSAIMDVFTGVLKALAEIILEIEGEFKQIGAALDGVVNAAIAAGKGIGDALDKAFHFDADGAVNALKATASRVGTILEDESDESVRLHQATHAAIAGVIQAGGKKEIDLTQDIADGMRDALEHAFDGIGVTQGISPALLQQLSDAAKKVKEFSDGIKEQASSFNLGSSASINFKLTTGALGEAVALAKKDLDAMTSGALPFNEALAESANKTLAAAAAARTYAAELQQKQDTKEIDDFTNKLQDQVIKFGQSDVAAIDFAATVGKLGDSLKRAADGGDAARAHIHDLAVELTDDKDKAALFAVDQQILTLSGHLAQAAAAGFQFQNALLIKNVAATGDAGGQKQLDTLQALQVAQAQYNELQVQAQRIQADEALQEDAINRAVKEGTESQLDGQRQISDARLLEVQQLGSVYTAMKAISDQNATTLPALVDRTKQFGNAIANVDAATHELADKLRTDFASSASDAFASFVTGAESASQAAHQFLTSFLQEIIKLATNKALEDLFGATGQAGGGGIFGALAGLLGGGAGNGLSAGANASIAASESSNVGDTLALLAGGGVASGGPVTPGHSYTVGEYGAEEFVPDVPGTIVPNSKVSKGMTIIQNFSLAAPQGTVSRQTLSQVSASAGDGISRSTRRDR